MVSTGGPRRGRRDNGLDAIEYAVAGDVDPRVGEHLLDVLAAGGIAAYLQPASDLNPVTRTTTVPARPTDRLYVDRAHVQTARDHLARLAREDVEPAPARAAAAGSGEDAVWESIVAGYDATVDPTAAPWPAAEELTPIKEAGGPRADPTADPAPTRRDDAATSPRDSSAPRPAEPTPAAPEPEEPSLLDALDTFGAGLPDEDEEGYTPPPPPPLPRISRYAVIGVLAMLGGFVLFMSPGLLPISAGATATLGLVAVVTGFIMLIARLRPGGDDDDDPDPDDGAVV